MNKLYAYPSGLRKTAIATMVTRAVGLVVAGSAALPALAQTPAAAPAAPIQRVEVTGSHVRRTDAETPSPTQVITADELLKSGFSTINEVLQNITANGQGMLSTGFSGAFAAGASGISLRGLTVGATLVLVDGHRMAGYPLSDDAQRSFVDISSIPFDAVERIEVLKDGASAVYGSDAVAGVVNVILKRRYRGTGIDAGLSTTEHGGGTTRKASLIHGFGSDDHHGYFALEYRRQDPILLKDRSGDWNSFDWRSKGGVDLRPGSVNHVVAAPRVLTPILQAPGSGISSPASFAFLDNRCNHATWTSGQCLYDNDWAQLQPATANLNLTTSFSSKIDSNWDLNLKGSFYNSEGRQTRAGATVPFGTFGGNTAFGPGTPPTAGVGANNAFRVPANYPGNTLGVPANIRALLPDTNNRRVSATDTDTLRLVAELRGELMGWSVDAAIGHTRAQTRVDYEGYVNYSELFKELNNRDNPFKLGGGNSAAVMARVAPHVSNISTNQLDFVDLRATRELMQLAGGPLGVGAGLGYLRKDLNQPDTVEAQMGTVNGLSTAFAIGKEVNRSAFVEVVAPVMQTVQLEAAVRHDDFSTFGGSTTPKAGFKFSPMKELAVRGTVARGFRAPNPAENGISGSQFSFNNIRDPLNCPISNANGTPNLTAAGNVPAFCSFAPTYLQVSTPDLQPEKSKSFTLGLIVEPVRGWSSTLDFYSIEIKNQIIPMASLATFDPLAFAVRSAPQAATYGDGSTGLTPAGTIAYIAQPYVNGQTTKTTGVELETRYRWDLGSMGRLKASLQYAHLRSYQMTLNGVTSELAGTHGPAIIGGNTGNPKGRGQVSLSWERGPLTATVTTHYVSGYDLTDPANGVLSCDDGLNYASTRFADTSVAGATQYCRVKSFNTSNLNLRYQFNKQLTVIANINNLLDQAPPVDQMTYGGTGSNSSSGGTGAAYNPGLPPRGARGGPFGGARWYTFNCPRAWAGGPARPPGCSCLGLAQGIDGGDDGAVADRPATWRALDGSDEMACRRDERRPVAFAVPLYWPAMLTPALPLTTAAAPPAQQISLRRSMLAIGLVWGCICLAQFAASIGDLSAISGAKLVKLTLRVAVANVPLAAYCAAQTWIFARPAGPPLTARAIARSLGLGTVLWFIPSIALQATYLAIEKGKPAADVLTHVANYPPLFLVYDYMMFAGCFATVLAEAAWQHKRLADQARERAERENLALRLALEQQRLRTLQAQLEPHFLFNSLNAISALVRAVNTPDALGAISTLSQLLRRAVHASLHPWVPLDDELQFARDYLKLQQLRYGERLVVQIDCALDGHGDAEVPALLLQPLIENAIRHDVERHHGVASIAIGLRAGGGQLDITLTNALCDSHAPNPGSGLGLANIRSRLALLYPGSHAFSAGPADGRYLVRLRLPLDGHA